MSDNRLTERVQAVVRATVRASGVVRLLVACSGGGDSVCLAHATVAVARQEGWYVAIGHVRHGMRADDAEDAALVGRLALTLDVPVFEQAIPHSPSQRAVLGLEVAAPSLTTPTRVSENVLRIWRYRALAEIGRGAFAEGDPSCSVAILMGHTQDDQAETVLMRLLRGSGTDGLSAMRTVSPGGFASGRDEDMLVRPFLTLRREETRAYCIAHDLTYLDDPTNDDTAYTRNWVRHAVMPVLTTRFPDAVDAITRAADLVRDDADVLRAETDAALARCHTRRAESITMLDRSLFAREPMPLQRRILRSLLPREVRYDRLEIVRRAISEGQATAPIREGTTMLWPAYQTLSVGFFEDVIAAVRRRALQRHPLTHLVDLLPFDGTYAFPADDVVPEVSFQLTVAPWKRQPVAPRGSVPLRLPGDATLVLRNRRPGDRFHPARASGSRKLQDYLTEQGVPAPLRDELPLLVLGDEIVAVIGYDVASSVWSPAAASTHLLALVRTAPVQEEG